MIINDNYIGVQPGDRALNLMSNYCTSFSIGAVGSTDVWLKGEMVGEDKEFVFNGRLFLKGGHHGTVIDNFPKGPAPVGWERRPHVHDEGYDLVDEAGDVIFGYRVEDNVCHVTVNLYDASGKEVAHGGQGGLVVRGIGFAIG